MFKMQKLLKSQFDRYYLFFLSMQLYNYYNLENLGRYMHLLIHIVKNLSPPRSLEPKQNKGGLSLSLGATCKEFFGEKGRSL